MISRCFTVGNRVAYFPLLYEGEVDLNKEENREPMDLEPEGFRALYEDFTAWLLEHSESRVLLVFGRPFKIYEQHLYEHA